MWDLFFFPVYKEALASNSLAIFQDGEKVLRSLLCVGAGAAASFRGRGLLTHEMEETTDILCLPHKVAVGQLLRKHWLMPMK